MSYDRIVFLPSDSDMSEERLTTLLSKTFGRDKRAHIYVEENRTVVRWGDWSFRVYYESGPSVRQESREIVSRYASGRKDKKRLATYDKWITIASDSDYEMTHFNHFCFLLQDLEEQLPGAVLFVPEEGAFFDPGDFN
jgi:hypothetical protein